MAIEAFHSEYGKYPVYLDEVDGKNEREKVYFEGIENTVEEYDIKMVFDDDHDGFVEVEGEKIKLKVAVWTYYKDQMINSWDK